MFLVESQFNHKREERRGSLEFLDGFYIFFLMYFIPKQLFFQESVMVSWQSPLAAHILTLPQPETLAQLNCVCNSSVSLESDPSKVQNNNQVSFCQSVLPVQLFLIFSQICLIFTHLVSIFWLLVPYLLEVWRIVMSLSSQFLTLFPNILYFTYLLSRGSQ